MPFARNANRVLAGFALTVLLMAAIILHRAPLWLGASYLLLGAASAVACLLDKRFSEAAKWRIPEIQLHAIDLCFGIIGGLLAQHSFRHKTGKPSFRLVTWAIAALHGAALAALLAGLLPKFGSLTR